MQNALHDTVEIQSELFQYTLPQHNNILQTDRNRTLFSKNDVCVSAISCQESDGIL